MRVLYMIGLPGAGKSTVFSEMTRGLDGLSVRKPIKFMEWWCRDGTVVELGLRRESFSGTDSLAMNVQPTAVEWLRSDPYDYVMAEGDRLGNAKFFTAVSEFADLEVVLLEATDEMARARRTERGSEQSEVWLKGRRTKVTNLAEKWADVIIGADAPPEQIARELKATTAVGAML